MTEPGQDQAEDLPFISPDFTQGDIHRGLEAMRRRLLDLSGRNRLLNYRYYRKSSLRVVDEVPDELFTQLVDGRELFFKAVPKPRRTDAPPDRQVPSAEDHARSLGILTSYDLPERTAESETDGRYTDRQIQTLHYPEDLEAVLRAIGSAARLAIEETGTNMLYLAFGFLEWYESAESTQPRHAPLVLLPVTLRRADADSRTGAYQYATQYSGEDIGANLTLQERLRRDFDLQVPALDDQQTPERYWAKLRPLLQRDERWRIHRHVSLTLLSFGKLLLYRDLDPSTWPVGQSPAEHARVRELFRGIQRSGITFAEDYRLDEPPVNKRVPLVCDDADSSQHSALVDAVAGQNVVIEGPPGTGKSQTICNLIAAAIQRGKSVLFVSEKLAALEVVRHRLDKLGLGEFCLELHSHKTQKRRLLDDLQERLRGRREFAKPEELTDRLQHLESTKRHLSDYVDLVNRVFGASRRTLYDIMWSAQRRKRSLTCDPELLAELDLPNPEKLSPDGAGNLHLLVRTFGKHLAEVSASDDVEHHPWFGVTNTDLTFMDEREIIRRVEKLQAANAAVEQTLTGGNAIVGAKWLSSVVGELEATGKTLNPLPASAGDIVPHALGRLRDPIVRRRLSEFLGWIARCEAVRRQLQQLCGEVPRISAVDATSAEALLVQAAAMAINVERVADYQALATQYSNCASTMAEASGTISTVGRAIAVELLPSRSSADTAVGALASLRDIETADLRLRDQGLTEIDASHVLDSLATRAAAIQNKRSSLTERFDASILTGVAEARENVAITANAGFFAVLSPAFRRAKRRFIAAQRKPSPVNRAILRQGYRMVLDYLTLKEAFDTDPDGRRVCRQNFTGIETRFDAMKRLVRWRTNLQQPRDAAANDLGSLATVLWSADAEYLATLRAADAPTGGLTATLNAGKTAFDGPARHRPVPFELECPWSDAIAVLTSEGKQLGETASRLAQIGFPMGVRIDDARGVLALVLEMKALARQIDSATEVRQLLGTDFAGANTNRERISATLRYLDLVVACGAPEPLKDWLLHADAEARLGTISAVRSAIAEHLHELNLAWDEFNELARPAATAWLGSVSLNSSDTVRLKTRLSSALAGRSQLPRWLDFIRCRQQMSEAGLKSLVKLSEAQRIPTQDIEVAFEFVVDNSMVRSAFRAHPQLARFSGLSHSQVRQRFQRLDRETMQLARKAVAFAAVSRPVPAGNGSGAASNFTELHLLEREVEKQKRHIPLRQLVRRAGTALQALKPCFMMGPLSVAQYLAPGAATFDLVIMDEASQLKPEDALGAIARASQMVVVGDRRQLPPTSFFDRLNEEEGDEPEETGAEQLTDAESILDVAAAVHRPTRLLRWHYRSRHGSLIAFSNREFYKNELIVFPSPLPSTPELGIKHIDVREGLYENRRNLPEAQRVVTTALRHMAKRQSETLGIVTLNSTQRDLVEEVFEDRLKRDPVAQHYVAERQNGLEPFFIKNLENVQGDERDVIYISVTYGRNAAGHVYQRFGPIAGATGHRRLNVLFTRARKRTVVFASMNSGDIAVQPTSAWGVRALKGYLRFAETGILEQASFSGRPPDSDFEIEVADALAARGFDVCAQIGVAGYFIDLAVKHPKRADAFILGIECDGAMYHSSKSARDRDRLREAILEGLGWKLHRIWSTDWFKQTEIEVNRVVERLNELLKLEPELPLESETFDQEDAGGALTSGWSGELAAQPLSQNEAREALIALRSELQDAGSKESTSLLRNEMLEALLRAKPRTKDDFLRTIPMDLRLETDGEEVRDHLDRVLEITARMAR